MDGERSGEPLRVVVAGGGVAALELTLALRDLAGPLVQVTLVSRVDRFTFAPAAVGEPFGKTVVRSFDLFKIANDLDAELRIGTVRSVDVDRGCVVLSSGEELSYRALVIACGASAEEAVEGAVTFSGPRDVDAVRSVVEDIRTGGASTLAFAIPTRLGWTLPIYELCLLTCQYLVAHDAVFRHSTGTPRRHPVAVSLVTPEKSPLEAFGSEISSIVRRELEDRNVSFLGARTPIRWRAGRLETEPPDGLAVERVIALPRLGGAAISGLPTDEHHLIPTDRHGRVGDLADVYAAGDITSFPIKQGGIAAQQAVAVAQAIAADAGAGNTPEPFEPVLRGLLLTGDDERFLRAAPTPGEPATASSRPLWWPPGKIAARYLTAYLAQLDADPSQRT